MAPGVWGKPSSTLDWCEDNYAVTTLIAEFWNTLSNVAMIIPPIVTIYLLIKQHIEQRFIGCHLSLLCVGLGSWCFHMTLLYSMQLFDELPMIWGSAFLVYAFSEVSSPPKRYNLPLQVLLFVYCTTVTIVYLTINLPIFFQIAYGIMVSALVLSCIHTVIKQQCNKKLFLAALLTYFSGFVLWNIDNTFCSSLRLFREDVSGFLRPFSELHAWWHVLAGLGTYLSILFATHTRCLFLNQKPSIKFWSKFWPYLSIESVYIYR